MPATAVRLEMTGEIRLGTWKRFRADEVIHATRGFVWRARVGGVVSGHDALVDGTGGMRWRMLGLFPVMTASGPDVTRSAIGRWLTEAVWLPAMALPSAGARWEGDAVTIERFGVSATLALHLAPDGALREVRMRRWGNPTGGAFGEHAFGAIVEEEKAFGPYALPSRVRVGWHIGTDAWPEGEFFRATVRAAEFR